VSDAAKLVLDVLRGTTPAVVRLMREGDVFPPEFDVGFDQLGKLDYRWIWVAERNGVIEGVVAASPCHGMALVWRVAIDHDSPKSLLLKLLRAFMRDIRQRGYSGYMTWVDPNRRPESQLRRVIEHLGGKSSHERMVLVAAPLAREGV
jgi:hypothetical protein